MKNEENYNNLIDWFDLTFQEKLSLEMQCELNRVSFRTVSPYYTSTTCPACGQTNRGNRNGEKFLCLNCGHADNADINAGKNILNRFLTGQYGARYKQENQENLVVTNFL